MIMSKNIQVALIAHDNMKGTMLSWCKQYLPQLESYMLFGTGNTSTKIQNETNLNIHKFKSGPLGGDQQVGAMIAEGKLDAVIFFRDPLTSMPHEPDVSALLRLCDVYSVPLATNVETANMIMKSLSIRYGVK